MKMLIELICRSSLTVTAKGLHVKGALAFLITILALLFVLFALLVVVSNDAGPRDAISEYGLRQFSSATYHGADLRA